MKKFLLRGWDVTERTRYSGLCQLQSFDKSKLFGYMHPELATLLMDISVKIIIKYFITN